jgi:hypothetical protein
MNTMASQMASTALVVRRMAFPFDGVPRHWFGGSLFRTHLVNGVNFVFPAGERFFIRSVNHYATKVSPAMRERIRGFAGQEAMHQVEHLRFFATLESQGYEIQSFLEWYERVAYEFLEGSFPPEVRLATTAALEHYTATLGEFALRSELLDLAHHEVRDLLLWHAAEEIEHKSVAYDLLQEVDPRYRTRLKGFAVATGSLFYFWIAGVRHLMAQEPAEERAKADRDAARWLVEVAPGLIRTTLDFLRPGFHPDDHDNYQLAAAYLASIGRLAA